MEFLVIAAFSGMAVSFFFFFLTWTEYNLRLLTVSLGVEVIW